MKKAPPPASEPPVDGGGVVPAGLLSQIRKPGGVKLKPVGPKARKPSRQPSTEARDTITAVLKAKMAKLDAVYRSRPEDDNDDDDDDDARDRAFGLK